MIVVIGAGLGGLVAAASIAGAGAPVRVVERSNAPGGNLLLSSGVIWRHHRWEDFIAECPTGDRALQRLLWERLDGDLQWLKGIGAPVLEESTGNPLTTGFRFDTAGLCEALLEPIGEIELSTRVTERPAEPTILATGGFASNAALRTKYIGAGSDSFMLRSHPYSCGDGMAIARSCGAKLTSGMEQFYGRPMPDSSQPLDPKDFVCGAQIYGGRSVAISATGESFRSQVWSELDQLYWISRQRLGRAKLRVMHHDFDLKVGKMTIGERVRAAREYGAAVQEEGDWVLVPVKTSITSTLGGLQVDTAAQAAPNLFACGNDIGGIATGGYASGLAIALVFGRIAAESAIAAVS